MSWDEKGDVRIKRFKAYQELEERMTEAEERYRTAQAEIAKLRTEITRRDKAIRKLATDLIPALETVAEAAPETQRESRLEESNLLPKADTRPPPKASGMTLLRDIVNQQLAEHEAAIQKRKAR